MKIIIKIALLLIAIIVCSSNTSAKPITLEMNGMIGKYPATIVITMNNNKVNGYYKFKNNNAPQAGKITLTGTCRHNPDPEMPNYPFFKASLTSKTAKGTICGNWDVEFETRTGSIEGTCTINGKKYNVEASE